MQETSCPQSSAIMRNSCRAWTARNWEHWPIVQICQLPEARFATVDLDRNGVTRLLADECFMLSKENLERLMHPIAAGDS